MNNTRKAHNASKPPSLEKIWGLLNIREIMIGTKLKMKGMYIMNWQHFQTYNEASTRAFEAMCNQLFDLWVNREYKEKRKSFVVVNGAGGDGGVESYATLVTGEEIGVQAKWFLDSITASQFKQIKNSILTAMEIHPKLVKYIVCIPRDLSNLKKCKDGNIARDTEFSKWNSLVTDVKKNYPNVDIALWGDHAIEVELQRVEAAGVRRYWFEKEELTKEAIQRSFDMQKNGWLVQRYIPVLHNQGKMHKEISSFLGTTQESLFLLGELKKIEKLLGELIDEIRNLHDFIQEKNIDEEEIVKLEELEVRAGQQLMELLEIENAFQSENKISPWIEYIFEYDGLECLETWIEKCSHRDGYHHFHDIQKSIKKLNEINMSLLIKRLQQRCNIKKIIVIGGQGTGKTHGIANVVETQLEQDYHIPILIQAKSVSHKDDWKDIIIGTLGLSQEWSEEELWSALEALSYRNEINHLFSDIKTEITIVPKILICIDGIDEVKPYDRWIDRINQVDAIIVNHPRIRFCFTGRSYAFESKRLLQESRLKKVYLSADGDVQVSKIYESYMKYYNVNDEGAKWLRYSISTPYTLKLLCELYEGKRIGQIGKSDVTVTNLLREKFNRLNEEFKIQAGYEENTHDQFVKNVLLKINEIFETQNEVARVELKSALCKLNICRYLNETGIDKILDFFEKHSFLQSYQKESKSFFEEDETIYFLGVQPVYDYIKALRLFEKIAYSDELELDRKVLENTGALQMYAVMVLENYEKILWENKSCGKYLNEEDLFSIVAFSLVNVDENIAGKFADWLSDIMSVNAYALSLAVNRIILPLARNRRHPLGSILLDQYLNEFEKPADRDVIWSIPSGLNGNDDSLWIRYDDIAYELYTLENTDCYDGMPLVWAWGLTSVDNSQRTKVRKEITKWGIEQPEEFFKLFEKFSDVNDMQVKTDIFAIAMAVAHVCRKNKEYLRKISKWIYHNIFQYGKIKNMHNAAIRYYSRAIMECSYSEGVATIAMVNKSRPPYKVGASLLPFATEATTGTRMGGYKTMDYDLSRYVLCDPLERKFLRNRNNKCKVNNLIEKYGCKYHIPNLTSEKWILGCAFGIIQAAGWREDIFYGKPNGGKEGEILGLDIAIGRKFWSASHGSMSHVMTITEKYTWCAKMELLGYLADRIFYHDDENDEDYVQDYGLLEDYINPYQEVCQVDVEKIMEQTEWILPEDLVPSLDSCDYDKKGIQRWLQESPIPNFEKWICICKDKMTLFSSHCVSNESQGVTTMMWISSGLIQKGTMSALIKRLKDKDFSVELIKAVDFLAYPASDCYISPLEVSWFNWKEEHDSELAYGSSILYKNVAKCTCDIQEKGETEYQLPSKKLRQILGIVSGDGYHYYNDDGIEIASYRDAGERYDDSQHMLLVDKEIFLSKTDELNLQPVWIIRVLKEISNKANERINCFMDRDDTYLVWRNSKGWKTKKIEWED